MEKKKSPGSVNFRRLEGGPPRDTSVFNRGEEEEDGASEEDEDEATGDDDDEADSRGGGCSASSSTVNRKEGGCRETTRRVNQPRDLHRLTKSLRRDEINERGRERELKSGVRETNPTKGSRTHSPR